MSFYCSVYCAEMCWHNWWFAEVFPHIQDGDCCTPHSEKKKLQINRRYDKHVRENMRKRLMVN